MWGSQRELDGLPLHPGAREQRSSDPWLDREDPRETFSAPGERSPEAPSLDGANVRPFSAPAELAGRMRLTAVSAQSSGEDSDSDRGWDRFVSDRKRHSMPRVSYVDERTSPPRETIPQGVDDVLGGQKRPQSPERLTMERMARMVQTLTERLDQAERENVDLRRRFMTPAMRSPPSASRTDGSPMEETAGHGRIWYPPVSSPEPSQVQRREEAFQPDYASHHGTDRRVSTEVPLRVSRQYSPRDRRSAYETEGASDPRRISRVETSVSSEIPYRSQARVLSNVIRSPVASVSVPVTDTEYL